MAYYEKFWLIMKNYYVHQAKFSVAIATLGTSNVRPSVCLSVNKLYK